MNLSEAIIRRSFKLSVKLIESFNDMTIWEDKVNKLRSLEDGTLGKDMVRCLDKNGLRLVPGYGSHDLKHVLLGFDMTPVDEIRLQAFMLGNGNISLPSILIFLYGFILLPYKWGQFYKDMILGYNSLPIKSWSIEEYAHFSTGVLRERVIGKKERTSVHLQLPRFASFAAMFAGIFGMLYCLPFLFSSRMEDLVGAGFPFVGGAIIFSAGLISFTLVNKKKVVALA